MSNVATSPTQVKNGMSDTKTGSTALVKHAGQLSRITTPDEFRDYLEVKRNERWHLLSPATDFGSLPQQWALVPTVVKLDPNPETAKDVYRDALFCKGDEVALSAVSLRKIANAGGSIIRTIRLDDGRIPYLWSYKAVIRYRSFVDALWKEAEGESTYDLRDGSPRISKMIAAAKRNNRTADAQIEGARMHGQAGCESRAINRAIRGAFSLKQVYTREELAKPFVAFNLVFQPDMNDPQQKAAVLQNALGGTDVLYGGTPTPAPALQAAPPISHASDDAIDGETVREDRVRSGPAQTADASNEVPFEDDEPDTRVLVSSVSKNKDSEDYFITTDVGRLHTSDRGVAAACNDARKAGTRLKVELGKKDGDVTEIVEVLGAEKL